MKELFQVLHQRLSENRKAVMVSVIHSSGSAPRGPGARMLADEDGWLFGTVGGGKVEHESVLLAQKAMNEDVFFIRDFALRNREAADLGMVCGGDMRILFQCLGPEHAHFFTQLLAKMEAGEPAYLVTALQTGEMRLEPEDPGDNACFTQRLSGGGRTYVFGGGHVAQALVPLLAQADFFPVVVEDRPEFASPSLFPDTKDVRLLDFQKLGALDLGPEDNVVIMTRGHVHDQAVLSQMLKTTAGYVGMIGSRAKIAHVYANLREEGFSDKDIARVHSPIGLPIQAETPFEIAVSIMAELIACRAQRRQSHVV
ncbi:MAG: XdhC family protein [Clostridiales bacterium]|nr:XdhC family protein [Clostridiales bacterium]